MNTNNKTTEQTARELTDKAVKMLREMKLSDSEIVTVLNIVAKKLKATK
jgi:hypothetical protein